jgi:hypothetical protein
VTSCTHPVSSIQDKVISNRVEDCFGLEVLTPMGDVGLTVGLERVLFDPKHSMKLLGKEDCMMNTT